MSTNIPNKPMTSHAACRSRKMEEWPYWCSAVTAEEHNIARPRRLRSNLYRALDRSRALDRHASGDLLFNFLRGRADQKRKNRLFAQRFLQRGVIAAFIFASEHDQDSPGERIQRLDSRIHVRGLRIVVVAHPANLRNELQTMLHACERMHAAGDLRRLRSCEACHRHRGQYVFNVVSARQRNVLQLEDDLVLSVFTEHDFVLANKRPLGDALLPAEPEHLWLCRRVRSSRRIIRVQHRTVRLRLIFKDSRFRSAIGFQRVVAIQMVRREIQKYANVGAKRINQLELETAQLYYGNRLVARLLDLRNQRRADIPGENRGDARTFQNVRDQGSRRRLAIRTRDSDHAPF